MNEKTKMIPVVLSAIAISILCAAPRPVTASPASLAVAPDTGGSKEPLKKNSAIASRALAARSKHAPATPEQEKARRDLMDDQMNARIRKIHAPPASVAKKGKTSPPKPAERRFRHGTHP